MRVECPKHDVIRKIFYYLQGIMCSCCLSLLSGMKDFGKNHWQILADLSCGDLSNILPPFSHTF